MTSEQKLVLEFRSLPLNAMPSAIAMNSAREQDNENQRVVWKALKKFVTMKPTTQEEMSDFLAYAKECGCNTDSILVRLRADRDGWRDGCVVSIPAQCWV